MSVTGSETPTPGDLGLFSVLSQNLGPLAKKALNAYLLGATAWRTTKVWREKIDANRMWRCSVEGSDPIYAAVHEWLLDMLPLDARKAVTVRSSRGDSNVIDSPEFQRRREAILTIVYDGRHPQTVDIDGHSVKVWAEDPTTNGSPNREFLVPRRIIFQAGTVSGYHAVLKLLQLVADAEARSEPRCQVAGRWGGWTTATSLPPRSIDSVVLTAGVMERLVCDLQSFLAAESEYAHLGVPWHRGYLLHGPPGGGKTSIARALASRFGLDVFLISLPDMKEDTELLALMAQIPPRSVLVIEDIDVSHAATSREDAPKAVSAGALLNALDGITTPNGLITIMTTNRLAVLDDAIVRPGRADIVEEIGYLDDEQLARLVQTMTGVNLSLPSLNGCDITPAEVIGILKEHIGRPAAGARAVGEWLSRDVGSHERQSA